MDRQSVTCTCSLRQPSESNSDETSWSTRSQECRVQAARWQRLPAGQRVISGLANISRLRLRGCRFNYPCSLRRSRRIEGVLMTWLGTDAPTPITMLLPLAFLRPMIPRALRQPQQRCLSALSISMGCRAEIQAGSAFWCAPSSVRQIVRVTTDGEIVVEHVGRSAQTSQASKHAPLERKYVKSEVKCQ